MSAKGGGVKIMDEERLQRANTRQRHIGLTIFKVARANINKGRIQ